eukprot:TCALIF_02744-PA protein Name:"Similar to nhr-7 Nuclear hormone receptor family member nhr-7 (Caenorhabditis elegans)" AED:0.09 eAED:0.09 QI:0/0.66/0.5/0.75/1/1/4/411/616
MEADLGSSASSIHSTEVNSPESEQSSSSLSPKRHGDPTNPSIGRIAPQVDVTTVCLICGDQAIRHVHYGGRCCFSCKAFFRRAVNWHNSKVKLFQCRNVQNCRIDIKSRKCCQYCRFQKCLDTGMNPSWVLSDDERQQRFQKRKAKQQHQLQQRRQKPGPKEEKCSQLFRNHRHHDDNDEDDDSTTSLQRHGLSKRMASRSSLNQRRGRSRPSQAHGTHHSSTEASSSISTKLGRPASSSSQPRRGKAKASVSGLDTSNGTEWSSSLCKDENSLSAQQDHHSLQSLKVRLTRNQNSQPVSLSANTTSTTTSRSDISSPALPLDDTKPSCEELCRSWFALNHNEKAELDHLENLFQRSWSGDVRQLKLKCKWSDWQAQFLALDENTADDSSNDSNGQGQNDNPREKVSEKEDSISDLFQQSLKKSSKDCLIRSLYLLQEVSAFQDLSTFDQEQLFITNMSGLSYLQSVQYQLIHSRQKEFLVFSKDSIRFSHIQESSTTCVLQLEDDSHQSSSAKMISMNQSVNLEKIVRIFGHFQLPRLVHMLLMLIVIFSNDTLFMREIGNNELVEQCQIHYLNLLEKYLFSNFQRDRAMSILAQLIRVILLMRDDILDRPLICH